MSESADFTTESAAIIIDGTTYPFTDATRFNRAPVITRVTSRGLMGTSKRQLTTRVQGHTFSVESAASSSLLDAAREAWTAARVANVTPKISYLETRFYPANGESRQERTDDYVISSWDRSASDGSESTHSIQGETGNPTVTVI